MRNLLYKLGILLALSLTGLSMSYMNCVKCPPLPPQGYHEKTAIIGLELSRDSVAWYNSTTTICTGGNRLSDVITMTERDFLFIACYSFFFIMLLLVAFRDKPVRFWIGIAMVILIALFDLLENRYILKTLHLFERSEDKNLDIAAGYLNWMFRFAFSKWVMLLLLDYFLFLGVWITWNRLKIVVTALNLVLLLLFILIPNYSWFDAWKTSEWVLGYFFVLLLLSTALVWWRKRTIA